MKLEPDACSSCKLPGGNLCSQAGEPRWPAWLCHFKLCCLMWLSCLGYFLLSVTGQCDWIGWPIKSTHLDTRYYSFSETEIGSSLKCVVAVRPEQINRRTHRMPFPKHGRTDFNMRWNPKLVCSPFTVYTFHSSLTTNIPIHTWTLLADTT